MKEEKMMILSMLEEGKITSEEAVRLMEALEDMEIPRDERKTEDEDKDSQKEENSSSRFNSLEDIGADISNVFSNMLSGLKDIGGSFGFKNNHETIYEDLDMDISHFESLNLNLRAINGSIKLIPTNAENLSIKVSCQHKKGLLQKNEPYFDFYLDGDTVVFNPKYNSGLSIKLDVFLPEIKYNNILLNSTNGKIDVNKLNVNILECNTSNSAINIFYVNSKEIILSTKNGKIESQYTNSDKFKAYTTNSSVSLAHINSDDLDIKTANGRIDVDHLSGENIVCKTSNGSINIKNVSFNTIGLTTSNGRITCDEIDTNKAQVVNLKTSNASISSKIKDLNKEISFDLETSMGSISLETSELIYTINKQVSLGLKKIVAHTVDFNNSDDNLEIVASTSNGSIQILKG